MKTESPDVSAQPHAKTAAQARSEILSHIRFIAEYWAALPDKTPAERCDGVAFSLLVMIDGETVLPAMTLALAPHEDDRTYYESRGANWYKPGQVINGDVMLHEEYCRQSTEAAEQEPPTHGAR